ncbi:MAG: ATP-binding protein [Desulfobacteraceae bacterium]|nr:ATP-binding protein [Desulfobacteraceae bacterium]MBC2755157.1 ATP-binding protein [Desulfobacteraceae bacterium]
MDQNILAYFINEIPDPFDPQNVAEAGGDVLKAVARDFEQVLRIVSNLPPHSVTMTIRYVFNPTKENKQSALALCIIVQIHKEEVKESIRILIENGPINRFYKLHKIEKHEIPYHKIKAACEITRRENPIKPLHTREFNVNIPDCYYTIQPFKPNEQNNYDNLDRILADARETIIIDICVEPAPIEAELSNSTRYLSRLQSINRRWDIDEDHATEIQDYLEEKNTFSPSNWRQNLAPLRYQDPLADDILRSHSRFHESLQRPHLLFQIRVLAESTAVTHLIGSVVAESYFTEGSYRLFSSTKGDALFDQTIKNCQELQVQLPSTHERLFKDKSYSGFKRLDHLATVEELLGAFRLPVATSTSPKCIRKNTDPIIDYTSKYIHLGNDMEGAKAPAILQTHKICNHCFVSGMTGKTKTNTMRNIILQLHEQKIPFLVIEPVKTEYRILKTLKNHPDKNASRLAKSLEVYTVGVETVSPFRFNPLWILPGISIDEHIDNILACFMASMPVADGPLPALLGEALERVYENYNEDDPPILSDLVAATGKVLAEKGYSADTNADISSALEVRLGMLIRRAVGTVFQCSKNIPSIDRLMNSSSILEFDRVHTTQACLIILFLLTSIREYLKIVPKTGKDPRFVIIIEEAHNIVGRTGQATPSPDVADPKAFAAEYICRMLAELRALGVGIFIMDQHNSAVAPEVIKNTSTKIAFPQVDMEDREVIGAAMLFGPKEMEEIARLPVGEAYYITEGYHGPRRIKTENLQERFDLNTIVIGEHIIPYLQDDDWLIDALTERIVNELEQLKNRTDSFNDERLRINQAIASLLAQRVQVMNKPKSNIAIKELCKDARTLSQRLNHAYKSFLTNPYCKYFYADSVKKVRDPLILEFRDDLIHRIESIIKPDVNQSLEIIENFIRTGRQFS